MKNKTKKKFIFKGFDWTEVLESLGVKVSDDDSYTELRLKFKIEMAIQDYMLNNDDHLKVSRENKIIYDNCMSHTKVVSKSKYHYASPVWKGMSQIKNPSTFLQFFKHFMTWMWS